MFHRIFVCFVDASSLQWPTLWLQLTEFFSAQAGEHPVFFIRSIKVLLIIPKLLALSMKNPLFLQISEFPVYSNTPKKKINEHPRDIR